MSEAVSPPIPPFAWEGKDLRYSHTYGTLLQHFGQSIRSGSDIGYWEPALLVRGIVEYKIKHPGEIEDIPTLVSEATSLAIETHRGSLRADRFESFLETLGSYTSLSRSMVTQQRDRITAYASKPEYSRSTAKSLKRHIGNAPTLFIVLGHGAITAGIATYINYINSTRSDSIIYPVRFSTQKKKDTRPQLNEGEADYLRTLAGELSRVVVFDEDCDSGNTLRVASAFFDGLLDAETVPVANYSFDQRQKIVGTAALTKLKGN